MNNKEFTIGKMLNNEDHRIKYSPFISEEGLVYDVLKSILDCLKQPDFSFHKIYLKYGKEITLKSIELANKCMIIELKNRKML